jgi:hypothetical protein
MFFGGSGGARMPMRQSVKKSKRGPPSNNQNLAFNFSLIDHATTCFQQRAGARRTQTLPHSPGGLMPYYSALSAKVKFSWTNNQRFDQRIMKKEKGKD